MSLTLRGTRMSATALAAMPAQLAPARTPCCIAVRALRSAAAAPAAAAGLLPWCWRVSRPPPGRGVRATAPLHVRARVRAAALATGAGASGAPPWLTTGDFI